MSDGETQNEQDADKQLVYDAALRSRGWWYTDDEVWQKGKDQSSDSEYDSMDDSAEARFEGGSKKFKKN